MVWCPGHDTRDRDPLQRGVTRAEDGGVKLLGAPVGGYEFEEQILELRLQTVQSLLDRLHLLEDPHMEYALLRSCFSFPKFGYSLRTVDTSRHPAVLTRFDQAIRTTIEATLGTPLTQQQWAQASLPTSTGGLGLRLAASHGAAAYLASVGATESMVQEMRNREEITPEVGQAMESLNAQLGDHLTYEVVRVTTQRALSVQIDAEASRRLQETLTSDRDKARMKCVEREGAGDYLNAMPSKGLGLHLRKQEFIFAIRFRLGLRVFETEGDCPMPRCTIHSDAYGDHAISCAINGERIAKHNHLRDAIYGTAVQARLSPAKEPSGLLPGTDERPADVLLPHWTEGRDTALDITVINPLQSELVSKVAKEGDAAVQHAYNRKMTHYYDRCATEGITFIPLAVDVMGGWHKVALATLTRLGRQVARTVGKEEADAVRQLRQRLSVLLMRDNMAMLSSRAPTYPTAEVDGDDDE